MRFVCSDSDDFGKRSGISLHRCAVGSTHDGKDLKELTHQASVFHFFHDDGIGMLGLRKSLFGHFSSYPHGIPRTREGVLRNHLLRKSYHSSYFTNFIFIQVSKGFYQLKSHMSWESSDIVVRFDIARMLGSFGLDHIRVDRSLSEKFGIRILIGHLFKDIDIEFSDGFSFFFRILLVS